jgi:hypothetical protein
MPIESTLTEHRRGVVTRDVPACGLKAGDMGVVVHIDRTERGEIVGYMLELFAADGATIDVVSVPADAVRPAMSSDQMAVRPVAAE